MALDVSTAAEAQKLVQRVGDAAGIYKVGLQLFTAEGPGLVRDLVSSGKRIFLDLKLHDIPNTVAHGREISGGAWRAYVTVHASGGAAMLRAATEAAAGRVNILGVTVLTSLNDEDMQEIGVVWPRVRSGIADGVAWRKARDAGESLLRRAKL